MNTQNVWQEYHSMGSYSQSTSVYWNCWRQQWTKLKLHCPAMDFIRKMLYWAAKAITLLTLALWKKKKSPWKSGPRNVGLFFVGGLGFVCWYCVWCFFFGGGILSVRFSWGFFWKKSSQHYRKKNCPGFWHIKETTYINLYQQLKENHCFLPVFILMEEWVHHVLRLMEHEIILKREHTFL